MTDTAAGYRFNKDYNDLEQVAEYLPAFLARLAALESAGQYRYNDSFKGHVPGIEGPDEDTAIYLLQSLERQQEQDAKVAALLADGYEYVTSVTEPVRCAHVVLYAERCNSSLWAEYHDARLVPSPYGRNNYADVPDDYPYGVLPKGKRTNGHMISGRRVLVKS